MRKLELIVGPMFSGKSEEVIRRLKRAINAKKKILILKPEIDNRTGEEIAAREKKPDTDKFEVSVKLPAITLRSKKEGFFLVKSSKCDIVAIDEAQFFPKWFFDFINELVSTKDGRDLTIIVAGLDMDAWGKPFNQIPRLMAIATSVQKVTALCFNCGNDAEMTQKISGSEKQVEIGDSDLYEASCRMCHIIPPPAK